MKTTSFPLAVGAAAVLGLAVLATVGAPSDRHAPTAIALTSPPPAPSSVSVGGLTLTSGSIELPDDAATYPDGPHGDVINANCTACHSASMALTQPALSTDQWKAEVTKMREVYKAPIAEQDIPSIVAYLTAMPTQKAAPATGMAQDPDPKVAPDISGATG